MAKPLCIWRVRPITARERRRHQLRAGLEWDAVLDRDGSILAIVYADEGAAGSGLVWCRADLDPFEVADLLDTRATSPLRAQPLSTLPPAPAKSRRPLFTPPTARRAKLRIPRFNLPG